MAEKNDNLFEEIKKLFMKDYSYKMILQRLQQKCSICISERTLSRILKFHKFKRKNIDESDIGDVSAAIILELEGSGFNLGYRAMWKRLRNVYQLNVKQKTVMKLLKLIDPEGVEARARYKLKRRLYKVNGPNFLWHADGHDKLNRYGFTFYGFIDGFSRKILSLQVSASNKDPAVIAYHYLKLIKKKGFLPRLIRTDHGTEVVIMEDMHKILRWKHNDCLAGDNSFLKGSSTHNQRIESFWRQFRQRFEDFYIILFRNMEKEKLLDVNNLMHIHCLRYCFGHLIQEDILFLKREWNEHTIRKQNFDNIHAGKPNELYYCPNKVGATDHRVSLKIDHVEILLTDYAKKPTLVSQDFVELVTLLSLNCTPSSAEEAYELYLDITDSINKNM